MKLKMGLFLPSSCPEKHTQRVSVLAHRQQDWIYSLPTRDQLTAHPIQNDHPSDSRSRHGHLQVPLSHVHGYLHAEVGDPHGGYCCFTLLEEYFQVRIGGQCLIATFATLTPK
jgi:hypothetical protein